MKNFANFFVTIALAIASFFCNIFGLPTYPYGKNVDMSKFDLVWSDEFDGTSLDLTKWGGHYDWSADSTGTYIRKGGYWNRDMSSVKDGCLHIATRHYPDGYKGNGKPGWYSCGLDTMNGKFEQTYGYFECRCILPKGVGLWSAFWLYTGEVGNIGNGGIDGAEIDVFESAYYADKRSNTVSGAIHYDGYGEHHKQKSAHWSRITGNNPYEEFNTYGVEWNEKEYIFYINGVKAGKSDFGGACQVPENVILSVEVGGDDGVPSDSWAGPSIATNTEAPTDFIVDYVRVYQYK